MGPKNTTFLKFEKGAPKRKKNPDLVEKKSKWTQKGPQNTRQDSREQLLLDMVLEISESIVR